MCKILYFPRYILVHETKIYYYFASYGTTHEQHLQNKRFLIKKYNKSAYICSLTPDFPGKKVNQWIESLKEEDKKKYTIIMMDKRNDEK